METGYLNKYFSGVIVKKLSEVEANIESSNQHELNGNKAMRQILGTDIQRREFDTIFLYMEDEFTIDASGKMTWYDSRYNNPKEQNGDSIFQRQKYQNVQKPETVFLYAKEQMILYLLSLQRKTVQ